jgi:endonuclease/exonuclease/phosphatase family metal-dependent hydrolase
MSRYLVILCLCAAMLPAQTTLRVLTYNIHHGEGMDGELDLERIAGVIRSVEPDLVALQEVDVETRRTGGVDQALELAQLTGMHVLFGAAMPYQGGQYGNALLSKWPAAAMRNHALPFTQEREPRAIIEARFIHPFTARILGTHLDITRPDRMSAVEALAGIAPPDDTTPAIFMGDLNDTPDSPVLEALRAQGWVSAVQGLTVPVKGPKRQIDYILVRPAARWRVVEQRVLDEQVASDHLPVFAVLELK